MEIFKMYVSDCISLNEILNPLIPNVFMLNKKNQAHKRFKPQLIILSAMILSPGDAARNSLFLCGNPKWRQVAVSGYQRIPITIWKVSFGNSGADPLHLTKCTLCIECPCFSRQSTPFLRY